MNDSLTTILLINSLLIIILITTQNETKDSASAQSNTTTATSPLEFLTWGAVFCELIFQPWKPNSYMIRIRFK